MSEFIKALYVMWPDDDYLDKAIEAGINTLFISLYDSTPKEKTQALFKKYSKKAVNLIPIVANIQPGKILPVDQQFFDGQKYYAATPCPTNVDAIRELLKFPKK